MWEVCNSSATKPNQKPAAYKAYARMYLPGNKVEVLFRSYTQAYDHSSTLRLLKCRLDEVDEEYKIDVTPLGGQKLCYYSDVNLSCSTN